VLHPTMWHVSRFGNGLPDSLLIYTVSSTQKKPPQNHNMMVNIKEDNGDNGFIHMDSSQIERSASRSGIGPQV